MAAMFDPNAPMDFAAQASQIERQRKMAELLRSQLQIQQPKGQMVGDHYVAPHWSQQLASMFGQYGAAKQMENADTSERAMLGQQSQAANQWRSSLPQTIAAIPGTAPPDELGGGPPTQTIPAQPLTREAILKHTLAGLANPMTAKEAAVTNQSLTSDLTRGEDMAFRDQQARQSTLDRAEARQEDNKRRLEELQMRLEDRSMDRASREAMQRESLALRAEIAKGQRELGFATLEMRRDIAKKDELKRLPAGPSTSFLKNESGLGNIEDALAKVQQYPNAFGLKTFLPNALNTRMDPKGVDARAAVFNLGSLKIHDRSGAAVTASEYPRLVPFIPTTGDDAKTVEKKLKGFQREYQMMQQDIVDYAHNQGYIPPVSRGSTPKGAGASSNWEGGGGKVIDFGSLPR